jgi:hypothetical protein
MMEHSGSRPVFAFASCALIATLMLAVGCDKGPNPEKGLGLPESSSSTGPQPKIAERCPEELKVTAPEVGSPEAVIQDLYRALATPEDTEAAFEAFYKHFDGMKPKNEVRAFYWTQGRKHVKKYLHEGEGISFTVCKREASGPKLKLFIKALDGVKTNPPITLEKNQQPEKDGEAQWKVDFFTP